jgi:hypothetical protein
MEVEDVNYLVRLLVDFIERFRDNTISLNNNRRLNENLDNMQHCVYIMGVCAMLVVYYNMFSEAFSGGGLRRSSNVSIKSPMRTSDLNSGLGKSTQESVNSPNKNPLSIFFKNLKGEKKKKLKELLKKMGNNSENELFIEHATSLAKTLNFMIANKRGKKTKKRSKVYTI